MPVAFEQDILTFVCQKFPLAQKKKVGIDDPLIQSGLVDSLGIMEMVNHLAESYDLEITEEDLVPENFESVKAMALFVARKRNGA